MGRRTCLGGNEWSADDFFFWFCTVEGDARSFGSGLVDDAILNEDVRRQSVKRKRPAVKGVKPIVPH